MPDPHTPAHGEVFGGVDTHTDTHHAAALDHLGRLLGDAQFPATPDGCTRLGHWLPDFGPVKGRRRRHRLLRQTTSGIAAPARHPGPRSLPPRPANPPQPRQIRRHRRHQRSPRRHPRRQNRHTKTADGPIESVRVLHIARSGAIKARTAARNELTNLITNPIHGTMLALRAIAERITSLTQHINQLDRHLEPLVATTAPTLVGLLGIGTDIAGQLLVTAGDNPDRLHSEASFAKLCGVAPLPASSGRTDKHRLNRGGERQANRALHTTVVVRLRYCPRTQAYLQRRTTEGLTKRDIIRCLKRYVLREAHTAIMKDLARSA
ncbi:transposase [Lentzea alba]|uniref:transposase n=1 Tax=Lentzea alba TaxID=2714351 RepID=UPI001A944040|nr:transposase [Lentzea alba]